MESNSNDKEEWEALKAEAKILREDLLAEMVARGTRGGTAMQAAIGLVAEFMVRLPDSVKEYQEFLDAMPMAVHSIAREIAESHYRDKSNEMLDKIVQDHKTRH